MAYPTLQCLLFCFISIIYIKLSPFLFSYPLPSFFSIPLFFQNRCFFPVSTVFYSVESCQNFSVHFIKQKRRDWWVHDYTLYLFSENYPLLVHLHIFKVQRPLHAIDIFPNLRRWAKIPFFLSETSWSIVLLRTM